MSSPSSGAGYSDGLGVLWDGESVSDERFSSSSR